jgi:hypothetical protein
MKRLMVLVVAAMIPSSAFAGPCDDDYKKFCANSKSSEEANACWDQHKSELSPGCRANLEAKEACNDDIGKLCKDVKKNKVPSCLGEHKSELSPACQTKYEVLSGTSN